MCLLWRFFVVVNSVGISVLFVNNCLGVVLCWLTCFGFLWFCLGLVPLCFALLGGGLVGGSWFAMGLVL